MDARVVFILAVLGIVQCELLNSCSITKSFVNGHNQRRQSLARGQVKGHPAAPRMTYIIWDDELANKAQKWASRNKYEHNPDKTIPSRRFTVGENIYFHKTTAKNSNFNPEMAMKAWWDENVHYTYKRMSAGDFNKPKQVGHYTQMAWEDSTRLGCGISRFSKNGEHKTLVVCNYGSAGNFLGKAPYKSGKPTNSLRCADSHCSKSYGSRC